MSQNCCYHFYNDFKIKPCQDGIAFEETFYDTPEHFFLFYFKDKFIWIIERNMYPEIYWRIEIGAKDSQNNYQHFNFSSLEDLKLYLQKTIFVSYLIDLKPYCKINTHRYYLNSDHRSCFDICTWFKESQQRFYIVGRTTENNKNQRIAPNKIFMYLLDVYPDLFVSHQSVEYQLAKTFLKENLVYSTLPEKIIPKISELAKEFNVSEKGVKTYLQDWS